MNQGKTEILSAFIPKVLSFDEVCNFLTIADDKIKSAPNDGLAMKEAMFSALKAAKLCFEGKTVNLVVKNMRLAIAGGS